jgi:hypothetical protein
MSMVSRADAYQRRHRWAGLPVAVVYKFAGCVCGGLGIVQALRNTLNKVWGVPRDSRPNPGQGPAAEPAAAGLRRRQRHRHHGAVRARRRGGRLRCQPGRQRARARDRGGDRAERDAVHRGVQGADRAPRRCPADPRRRGLRRGDLAGPAAGRHSFENIDVSFGLFPPGKRRGTFETGTGLAPAACSSHDRHGRPCPAPDPGDTSPTRQRCASQESRLSASEHAT